MHKPLQHLPGAAPQGGHVSVTKHRETKNDITLKLELCLLAFAQSPNLIGQGNLHPHQC